MNDMNSDNDDYGNDMNDMNDGMYVDMNDIYDDIMPSDSSYLRSRKREDRSRSISVRL